MAKAAEAALDRVAPGLLRVFLAQLGEPPFRFVLWDGRSVGPSPEACVGAVHLADRRALVELLVDAEMAFGDLYAEGRLTAEGDLVAMLTHTFRVRRPHGLLARLVPRAWLAHVVRNDPERAKRNALHHYDVGNDFYRLWLDERMVYTCAYFPDPEVGLEEAQVAKMDHVCRKLALRPNEHVIEAGSGWGSLALHMARHYGVTVRAFNVSEEQVHYAREWAEKEGLADRVEFVLDDYRAAQGSCDAFVSVGMLEHVGRSHYPELGRVVDRTLRAHGRGLLHTIARSREQRLNRWTQERVFPGAHPPTLREMTEVLEPHALVTLDVENLRRHYALTVRHWLERFERARPAVDELLGAQGARIWHLYLCGTIASFEASTIELFQLVFTRTGNDQIPWTRAHVYTDAADGFVADPAEAPDLGSL